MKRGALAGAVGAALATSLASCVLGDVDMAGKACDATHACLETYSCVDGVCTTEPNEAGTDLLFQRIDAGTPTDAGQTTDAGSPSDADTPDAG